jgi:steroid delta-isomerase-like uncharacterized protein
MLEQNKELARKVFEDVQTDGNAEIIDELVTADYVGHTPLGDIHGPEGARQFDAMLHEAFPDKTVTIEDQIAEGDRVVTRWVCHGTHNGQFQGLSPTGKKIALTGTTIFRIANGKLVEGWTQPNLLGLMQQLGAIPEPGQ